tara:strand:+ start:1528 stop:2505 length:978 start_codon:yes stop_codon:yes gene_type:complete
MKKYDVIGIGSALMDLLVEVDHSIIDELDLKLGETHFIEEKQSVHVFEKLKGFDLKTAAGGSSANTLAGVAKLGGSAVFSGKVGDDEYGRLYEQHMKKDGVKTNLAKSEMKTGYAITLITPDTQRTFVDHLGAVLHLKKEDLNEEDIKSSRILHVEGYQLEDSSLREVCIYAMSIAKENGVKVSIDLNDSALIRRNLEEFRRIVKDYANIVFANEDEAKAFTGLEPEEALHKIAEVAEIAVVKLGMDGSIVKRNGQVYRIEAFKANAVDTTGAGDIFAAGFLYGLCREYDMEKCGRIGSYFGARVVEKVGARLEHDLKDELGKLK